MKGDCFFLAIIGALKSLKRCPKGWNHWSLRQTVGNWFLHNGENYRTEMMAFPRDIIKDLPSIPFNFHAYNWRDQGLHLKKPGTWAGATELKAINSLIPRFKVNIYQYSTDTIIGAENNLLNDTIILLEIKDFHFTWLKPID